MNLCPEAEFRASMDDGDFWPYVLLGIRPGEGLETADGDDDRVSIGLEPYAHIVCAECGGYGPCGYDAEGRPMIHVTSEGDES